MLDPLIAKSQEFDSHKHDTVTLARDLKFDEQARLIVPSGFFADVSLSPMTPTDHAFGQVFSKLAPVVYGKGTHKVLPNDYLSAIDKDLLAQNLNRHLSKMSSQKWLVRGYDDSVRAVLSGDYPGCKSGDCFENTQYLQAVDALIEAERAKFPDMHEVKHGNFVYADMFQTRLVWRNDPRGGDGGGYGIGAFVQNDEIGGHKVRVYGLVKRTACDNSIIIDNDNTFEFVHRGSYAGMRLKFKEALGIAFRVSAQALDRMLEAENEQVPDFAEVMAGLSDEFGWPVEISQAAMLGTEGRQTRAAIVNGITYAAHTLNLDPENRLKMESLGGALLFSEPKIFAGLAMQHRQILAGLRN